MLRELNGVPVFCRHKPSPIERLVADNLEELGLTLGDGEIGWGAEWDISEEEKELFDLRELEDFYDDYRYRIFAYGYDRETDKEFKELRFIYRKSIYGRPDASAFYIDDLLQGDDSVMHTLEVWKSGNYLLRIDSYKLEKGTVVSCFDTKEAPILGQIQGHIGKRHQHRKIGQGNDDFYSVPFSDITTTAREYLKFHKE